MVFLNYFHVQTPFTVIAAGIVLFTKSRKNCHKGLFPGIQKHLIDEV